MESWPQDFAKSVIQVAEVGASWALAKVQGESDSEESAAEYLNGLCGTLSECMPYEDGDPDVIKEMACGAGLVTAAKALCGGEGEEEYQQRFDEAAGQEPAAVSTALWLRVQKLCWAASREACAQAQGDDSAAQTAKREKDRHGRYLVGFGRPGEPQDEETYASRAAEAMPATVIMFSGCKDSQTSADVSNTASFGLPEDAGPGGAGGACTNSMIKALSEADDYTWASLLAKMRDILDGQYTQIPQLSSSRSMNLNDSFSLTNPEPSGRSRALLIGINYKGSSAELRGCINDVETMSRYIEDHGFGDAETKILCDDGEHDDPTKSNIEEAFAWLVEGASKGDTLFLHYSGHGASVRDDNGDEPDGKDEALVPLDYQEAGLLRDDDVYKLLVAPLPEGVFLSCVLDCCHSGTILDLPYMFKADQASLEAVQDGSGQMQQNPDFDVGKVIQVLKEHPALAAAAVVAGGLAYAFMNQEQRKTVMEAGMELAKSFFG